MVDTKRIAKNTMFMYLRLIVTIPLAFFTSRIVLQQLGVDDFGIYNVVGGIVSFFSILRSSFASATQRFYNVSMASENDNCLSELFTTSLLVHIGLAVGLAIVIECFGMWFIDNKMNYPDGRGSEVYFCLHTAVCGMIFTIVNIPLDAMVIAKEKMAFYSYITIFDVILKLALVSILVFVSFEKLRLYAIFQMIVPIFIFILTLWYFRMHFMGIRLSKPARKSFLSMSHFAAWGLLGNIGSSLSNQGTNLLLNVFGGVAVNAAQGLSMQIRSVISRVLTDSIIAVRPQATQMFAKGEFIEFYGLINTYTKVLFSLAVILCLPIIIYANEFLNLWLGKTPEFATGFVILLMVYSIIRSYHEPLDIVFKSSARMKEYQLISAFFMAFNFCLSWLSLSLGCSVYSVFVVFILVEICLWVSLAHLSIKDRMNIKSYLKDGVIPSITYCLVCAVCAFIIYNLKINFVIGSLISLCLTVFLAYFMVLSKYQRRLIVSKLKTKIRVH